MALSRPPQYKEEVLSYGTVISDYLEISPENYKRLLIKYNPKLLQSSRIKSNCCGERTLPTASLAKPRIRGFGDVVAKVAQPIARGIDKVLGTNVANCGGCKQRREKLNQMFPVSGSA